MELGLGMKTFGFRDGAIGVGRYFLQSHRFLEEDRNWETREARQGYVEELELNVSRQE